MRLDDFNVSSIKTAIQVFDNIDGCFANMRYIPVSLNLNTFIP